MLKTVRLVPACLALLLTPPVFGASTSPNPVLAEVMQLESELDARIGISLLDTGNQEHLSWRGQERFPLSSTFKPLACAALLARVDEGLEQLQRRVFFDAADLVSYSPISELFTGEAGMSLEDLCAATMAWSDNTAGNLVLEAIGGPAGLTAFLRELGDLLTRLDRWETELNEALPGDPRDSTTPDTMVMTLQKLLLQERLQADSRQQLESWLQDNQVGDALLRTAIPGNWQIGDKTGAGGYGSRSITAIIRPPQRAPLIMAIYITETEADFDARNAAIARIGEALVGWLDSGSPD